MNQNSYFLSQTLDIAFKHLKLSALAILVNVIILSFVLYGSFTNNNLEIWFVYGIAVTISRILLLRFYLKKKDNYTIEQWETFFIIGVVFGALIWGSVPILLFDISNPLNHAMILFVMAGVSAGSIASLSSHYKSVRLFLFIVLIPLIIKLLTLNQETYYGIALLVLLFLIMLLKTAKMFHQTQISYIESQSELSASNSYLKGLIENAPIGIFSYDKNLIIQDANNECANISGAPLDYLIGLDMKRIKDKRVIPSIKTVFENVKGLYEGEYVVEYSSLKKSVSMHTSPILDDKERITGGLGIILDITDKVKMEKEFEYQAKYDTLTNIPNRYTLMDRLSQEISRFKRYHIIFAVIFIDLDHFKNINDSFGHSVGDELIVEVAKRFQKSIRDGDIVARLGGDEFVLLLPDLSLDENDAARKTELIIQKVQDSLEQVFKIQNYRFDVTASMGITLSQSDNATADDMLKHADMAMYKAKKDGRNLNRFYENSMEAYIQQRVQIESDLKNALKNSEFELYFQPITDVKSSKIVAAEALLHWTKNLSISPEVFIPIAEESGLIIPIGNWVLENALKEFKTWQQENMDIQTIAINISINQFVEPRFVKNIQELIEQYEINPKAIELELTESVIIKDFESSKSKMNQLRALGISLSIDDFGTGYSSLSYLKHLPFSTLKIDKSFTDDILLDEDDKKLVSTMILIAKNLDLKIIAEGVEKYAQLGYLMEKEADYYQGYFCSKPLNSSDFKKFLLQFNQNQE